LDEGGGRDDRDAAEGVQHQQVPVPADDELGMAVTASSRNLSSVGSRQAMIRSLIGTSSAAASILMTPSRKSGVVTLAM
jgi:hypothetical protein